MKTTSATTNLSAPSQTAAHFAMYLANTMKAHIALVMPFKSLGL